MPREDARGVAVENLLYKLDSEIFLKNFLSTISIKFLPSSLVMPDNYKILFAFQNQKEIH